MASDDGLDDMVDGATGGDEDAGPPADAGSEDAGVLGDGSTDGTTDGDGSSDASPVDAGLPDTSLDAGTVDGASADGGPSDGGPMDTDAGDAPADGGTPADAGAVDVDVTDAGGPDDADQPDAGGPDDADQPDAASEDVGGPGDTDQPDSGNDADQFDAATPACTLASQATDCGDADVCTDDLCEAGVCVHAKNTAACDDGDACTSGDQCKSGACQGGGLVSCEDNNPCTADLCEKATGCKHNSTADNKACDDGSLCTTDTLCSAGACGGGKAVQCDDGNVCTADACVPASGCSSEAVPEATACSDGDLCTGGDACTKGKCSAGKPISCDDAEPCTSDACDAKTGQCVHKGLDYAGCCQALGGKAGGTCLGTDKAGRKWGLVPAGTFFMGCNANLEKTCSAAETPQHPVTLTAPYWLGQDEVTVSEYAACVNAGACAPPHVTGKAGGSCADMGLNNWSAAGPKAGHGAHPVNCVSWAQSQAYCEWAGGSLPSEAQWALAARGRCEDNGGVGGCASAMRVYPWGNTPLVCGKQAVYNSGGFGCNSGGTWAAGTGSALGAGPYGHRDMTGNVWEWVWDYWDGGFYGKTAATAPDPVNKVVSAKRIVRGGSFYDAPSLLRAGFRTEPSYDPNVHMGVRCARPYAPCDDGNPCTVDSQTGAGACTHTPAKDGTGCNDGKFCTSATTCQSGVCGQGKPTSCDDGQACTTDVCDTKTDKCSHTALDYADCCKALGGKAGGTCLSTDEAGRKWGLVPSGTFWMGCNNALEKLLCSNKVESPQHKVQITKPFWLGRDEVTVSEYAACVSAGACKAPATDGNNSSPSCKDPVLNNWSTTGPKADRAAHPVNCVTWSQASVFCEWAGGQLPTEAQWELAARGRCEENGGAATCQTKMRVYPWGGSVPSCGQHAALDNGTLGCGKGTTWAAGTGSALGVGPYGHRDLAGNVGEWVWDFWGGGFYAKPEATLPDPKNVESTDPRILRGGDANGQAPSLRAGARVEHSASSSHALNGFRCARTYP